MVNNILLAVSLLLTAATASAQNITYNVIAESELINQSVAVVVDNTTFPLQVNAGILYQGEAPVAKQGYHYIVLNENKVVNSSEGFSRPPVGNNTLNEFFNRAQNTFQLATLPQFLPPLNSINRIESDLHISGQIPTIHIWGNQTAVEILHKNQIEDLEVKLNMTYIDLKNTLTFENVKVSLSGRSSRFVPKLSYTLKLKKKDDATLYGYKNFKLRAFGMDPSYVREYVAFSSIKAIGLAATEFSYIRVFINNKPVGLYGIIETFQDPWVANEFAGGNKDYTPGYLYQGQAAAENQTLPILSDLSYYPNVSYYNAGPYKIKAGPSKKNDEDYTNLQKFTKFVSESSANTSTEEWEKVLDSTSLTRAMALENLLGFSDGYMTMANNFYLYEDPNSSRMTYMPSDLDTTLGICLYDINMLLTGNYTVFPGLTFRPLTKKFFSYPAFSKPYEQLLLNLTQNLINPTIMNPFIDSVVDMLRSDIPWDLSLPKLGEYKIMPFANLSGIDISDFFPPGFRTNWSEVPQTFESSLNGPINSTTMESVKGFIKRKSDAIIAFYSQSSVNV